MQDLLLSDQTRANVDNFLLSPSHGILLVGAEGSGKPTLARHLAANLLNIDAASLDNYPHYTHVTRPEGKQDIPIADIRTLLTSLKLTIPGSEPIRRVVFIEDAHNLSAEAQNALLKALEEPSAITVFILSARSLDSLLPTVVSRVQRIGVLPVTLPVATKHYTDKYSQKDITSAWQLSQGAAGLLATILGDGQEHPLKDAVAQAKIIIAQNPYERLLALDILVKDKEQMALTLGALSRITTALHRAAVSRQSKNQSASLINARKLIDIAQTDLEHSVSPRLIALNLALNMPKLI